MQTRRALLGAGIALLLRPAGAFAQPGNSPFTGKWVFIEGDYTLVLTLAQARDRFWGFHAINTPAAQRGEEGQDASTGSPSVEGTIRGNVATVKWTSEKGSGTARVTLRNGELEWQRLTQRGRHNFPQRATLSRFEPTPPPPNSAVLPGRGIGKIRIGATQQQVRATLGKPKETHRFRGGLAEDRWIGKATGDFHPPVYVSVLYRDGKVAQIEVSSASFATREGLSTESNFAQFHQAYGPLKVTSYNYGDAVGTYYDSGAKGIAITITSQDYTMPYDRPQALIVHAPGAAVIPYPGGKPVRPEGDQTLIGP